MPAKFRFLLFGQVSVYLLKTLLETIWAPFWDLRTIVEVILVSGGTLEHQKADQIHVVVVMFEGVSLWKPLLGSNGQTCLFEGLFFSIIFQLFRPFCRHLLRFTFLMHF